MKSHVSDYLEVMQAIYLDACVTCAAKVSDRDLQTIRSRVKSEGVSFLTITLPSFCADFERSLADGMIDPILFRSFKKRRAIPAFLQGMLGHLFNSETGRINDEVLNNSPTFASDLVCSVRQICLAFKKIKLACTPEREKRAMESFIENERSFSMFPLPREDDEWFSRVSSVLWDNIMGDIRPDQLIPRHGPGQTAERIRGNRKYNWRFWHDRLEPYFPLLDSAYSASCGELGFKSEELEMVSIVYSDNEQPVRVTPVPKTLKGPRIIAIEPCCMQYAQQGIRRALYRLIESHWRTRGHINFHDQSVNQSLATKASISGRLATIDLSDASDRVPIGYALQMFRSNPDLKDAIEACRSTRAEMPDGRIIPLRKFASMGSALCFPVEAMYFYTICVVALLRRLNLPVSARNVNRVSRHVWVYGDDIIVPARYAATVLEHLRKYNCKVNERKTFLTGRFRESCGVDAFLGKKVTPTYVNTAPPKNRQQVKELISWTEAANHFYKRGFLRTSQLLFEKVERILGELPWVSESSQILGRHHPWPTVPRKRYNRRYQRLEISGWVQVPVYRTDFLEGYAALQKSLMKLEGLKSLDAPRDGSHLERSALYGEVAIKRRWVSASNLAGRSPTD
jgi:hypothetical protein